VTIHYADGTSSTQALGFPNWCCADTTSYGAEPAITTHGKNTPTGPAYPTTAYHVFYNDIPIEAGEQVVAVTLPQSGAIHIFATAFTSTPPGGAATGTGS
jgi:alpha-glucosidase